MPKIPMANASALSHTPLNAHQPSGARLNFVSSGRADSLAAAARFTGEAGDRAVSAVACLDVYFYIINKHTVTSYLLILVALHAYNKLDGGAVKSKGLTQAVLNISLI